MKEIFMFNIVHIMFTFDMSCVSTIQFLFLFFFVIHNFPNNHGSHKHGSWDLGRICCAFDKYIENIKKHTKFCTFP